MHALRSSLAAVAVSSVLGSSVAVALDRIEYASAMKIYFGGSAAYDNHMETVFIAGTASICDPVLGDIDIWRSTNQRVITCRVSNEHTPGRGFAPRASGGTPIAFHKEAGTSSSGVYPLISVASGQGHTARWLDVSQLSNDCVTTFVAATPTTLAFVNHSNCATLLTPVDSAGSATFDIHAGISENEPALIFPPPGGAAQRLVSPPAFQLVFGVPVTTALYRALQTAQFGAGNPCVGSDTSACVPSLNRSQLVALYTQNVFDWATTGLTAIPGVIPPTDSFVRICRRVATSGAQASYEAVLLGERCPGGVLNFAAPDDSSTITDTVYSPSDFGNGSLVNAAPSAANLRSCMTAANVDNYWGLGVMSTEILDGQFADFRLVAINGVAPTLTNVANNLYDFYTEITVNRISTTYAGNFGALPAGDDRRDIIELVSTRMGSPQVLANINLSHDGRPWGNGGFLAQPTTNKTITPPYTDAEMSLEPVSTQKRNGNACQPSIWSPP